MTKEKDLLYYDPLKKNFFFYSTNVAALKVHGVKRTHTGDGFALAVDAAPSRYLRLTVHDMTGSDAERLADDLASAALR